MERKKITPQEALQKFKEEVEQGIFPGPEHSFHIKDDVLKTVIGEKKNKGSSGKISNF